MSEPVSAAIERDGTQSLGVELCRLSLDLGRQRIRHRRQVGIAIRAALFAELALAGRIAGRDWPEAIGDSETGDPMPDSVHRAVAGRKRPIGWRHWFNHVDADRQAATERLVQAGTWTMSGSRIIDNTSGRTLLDQQRVHNAAERGSAAPEDVHDAILVLLLMASGGLGKPMPRRARKLARSWLPPMLIQSGRSGDAVWATMLFATRQIQRAAPIRVLSR
ncbi:MAG TPA: GPP34 family phosphoprotein [Jatrophihabitans sp.]|nr:GPP34 family phosphoprotein [Jatrophihabitans sp.]